MYADTPRTGTIYIDHITATASGTPDSAAPVVSASLDNSLWQALHCRGGRPGVNFHPSVHTSP